MDIDIIDNINEFRSNPKYIEIMLNFALSLKKRIIEDRRQNDFNN